MFIVLRINLNSFGTDNKFLLTFLDREFKFQKYKDECECILWYRLLRSFFLPKDDGQVEWVPLIRIAFY